MKYHNLLLITLASAVIAFSQSACAAIQMPQGINTAGNVNSLLLTLAPGTTLEMVRVPAGEFLMGSAASDTDAFDSEKPQSKLNLDEYLIGKYDVTNAQYAVFAKATKRDWTIPAGKENHPVVNVSWDDAVAFCQWASQVTDGRYNCPRRRNGRRRREGRMGAKIKALATNTGSCCGAALSTLDTGASAVRTATRQAATQTSASSTTVFRVMASPT